MTTPHHDCAARLQRLLFGITLAVGLVGAAPVGATGRGLLVTADTLDAHALEPLLTFSNGSVVDAQRLAIATPQTGYTDGDLFVHDLASGATRPAEAELAELVLVSPLQLGALRLKDLFDAPGVAVLFESSLSGPADPFSAEVFKVHRPLRGTEVYYPALERTVPEPAGLLMLVCGAGLLAALGHRRSRSQSTHEHRGADPLRAAGAHRRTPCSDPSR